MITRACARHLVLVLVICAVAATASGQSTSLAGAYSFSETSGTIAADASGNGNGATLLSGAAWTTAGRFGGGVQFAGGEVQLPVSESLTLTDAFTCEAWILPTTLTSATICGASNASLTVRPDGSVVPHR